MPNPTRREREEALIVQMRKLSGTMDYAEGYTPGRNLYEDLRLIYAALEAAHRRDDAIRKLTRFDRDMDSTMMADEYGDYVRYDDLRDILGADDAPQGGRT